MSRLRALLGLVPAKLRGALVFAALDLALIAGWVLFARLTPEGRAWESAVEAFGRSCAPLPVGREVLLALGDLAFIVVLSFITGASYAQRQPGAWGRLRVPSRVLVWTLGSVVLVAHVAVRLFHAPL